MLYSPCCGRAAAYTSINQTGALKELDLIKSHLRLLHGLQGDFDAPYVVERLVERYDTLERENLKLREVAGGGAAMRTRDARPWWWWMNPWLYIKRRDAAHAAISARHPVLNNFTFTHKELSMKVALNVVVRNEVARAPYQALRTLGKDLTPEERAECIAREPYQALRTLGKDLTPEERAECIARAPYQALRTLGKDLTPEELRHIKSRT
jgi:hypothetical protein